MVRHNSCNVNNHRIPPKKRNMCYSWPTVRNTKKKAYVRFCLILSLPKNKGPTCGNPFWTLPRRAALRGYPERAGGLRWNPAAGMGGGAPQSRGARPRQSPRAEPGNRFDAKWLFSVAFYSPAKSLTFSGSMENTVVGKKLKP